MNLEKAYKRDRKRDKKKNGMQTDNRSIFIIQQTIINKSKKGE